MTAQPWTIDAGDVQGRPDDIEGFRARFLHETQPIREFLDRDSAEHLFIVAPKGYGKTLLLQAKRMLLQRERAGMLVSPVNQLVDRPQSVPPIWRTRDLEDLATSYAWWFEVWGIAIRIASLQSVEAMARKVDRASRDAWALDAEPGELQRFAEVSRELQALFDSRRPDPVLFRLIERNVLGLADLERIAARYAAALEAASPGSVDEEDRHPFCALQRLGLLGVVRAAEAAEPDDPGAQVQAFAGPDDITAERRIGVLPRSRHYLVHPSLDAVIERAHGHGYAQSFHVHNIVGHGLPWRDAPLARFVLKGDVVGSSRTIAHPELNRTYPALFRGWAEEECRAHAVAPPRFGEGDSLLLVDDSAARLLHVAAGLLARMRRFAEFPRAMRFGAASGVLLEVEPMAGHAYGPASHRRMELTGRALVTASRLEAVAPEGCVVATDAFWQDAARGWHEEAVRPEPGFGGFAYEDGRFLVRKTEYDEGSWEILWSIGLG